MHVSMYRSIRHHYNVDRATLHGVWGVCTRWHNARHKGPTLYYTTRLDRTVKMWYKVYIARENVMKQLMIAIILEYEYEHSFEKNIMSREVFACYWSQCQCYDFTVIE